MDDAILAHAPDYHVNLIAPKEMLDDEINKFHSNLQEVMLYIKYSKDKQILNRIVKEDIKFQSMERQVAEVINVVTGYKLKYPEGKGDTYLNGNTSLLSIIRFYLISHYFQLRRLQNYIRHTVADAFLRLLNHMAVYIRDSGHMGMAETVADTHTFDSVKKKQTGLHLPECVWVNMGQPDIPYRVLRLQCVLVNPQFLAIKQITVYVNLLILPVNFAPFQAQHFPPAASRHQKQMYHRLNVIKKRKNRNKIGHFLLNRF